jgi:hypothetical protein
LATSACDSTAASPEEDIELVRLALASLRGRERVHIQQRGQVRRLRQADDRLDHQEPGARLGRFADISEDDPATGVRPVVQNPREQVVVGLRYGFEVVADHRLEAIRQAPRRRGLGRVRDDASAAEQEAVDSRPVFQ